MRIGSWLVMLYLLPFAGVAQKLKQNDKDLQSGQQKLESFPINIKTAPDMRMDVSLSAAGATFLLQLTGTGLGANTVNIDDRVIFLFDNDSTITVKSATLQDVENNSQTSTYRHFYPISQEDLEYLSRHKLQGIRKYSVKGFDDIFPDEREAANFRQLSAFFLAELDKAHLLRAKPVMPAFPGGREVMLAFLNRNLKSLQPLEGNESKTALIRFHVEADGSIQQIEIKQSAGIDFDNELLRILRRMPKWKPSIDNGKQVKAVVTQEIEFYRQGTKTSLRFPNDANDTARNQGQ